MSTGLILRQVESNPSRWACSVWSEGKIRAFLTPHLCDNAWGALEHFLAVATDTGLAVGWVIGEGLTHRGTMRRHGLMLRERAPGGGPKCQPAGTQRKRVTFWLSPAGILAIKQAAAESGRTLGEEIEARFLSDNH